MSKGRLEGKNVVISGGAAGAGAAEPAADDADSGNDRACLSFG